MSDLALATRKVIALTPEKKGAIAERLGVPASTLSSIAHGRIPPTLKNMELIAKGYDLKLSEFIALGE